MKYDKAYWESGTPYRLNVGELTQSPFGLSEVVGI